MIYIVLTSTTESRAHYNP